MTLFHHLLLRPPAGFYNPRQSSATDIYQDVVEHGTGNVKATWLETYKWNLVTDTATTTTTAPTKAGINSPKREFVTA